ncbi:MAG: hypothetical protein AB2653_07565 [Candidatus Thiodiazotropha endolucinida]
MPNTSFSQNQIPVSERSSLQEMSKKDSEAMSAMLVTSGEGLGMSNTLSVLIRTYDSTASKRLSTDGQISSGGDPLNVS